MRKVIFVGSTAFSGSTFFHMILANDPKGFSCGEVRSLFHPYRPQHAQPACGCGDDNCRLWYQVRERGADRLYETLFEMHPEVEFIVDSSKNPFWIQSQSENLRRQGIEVGNVLIWKTPLEFAYSCQRRDRFDDWVERWIEYHRRYFSLVDEWGSVKYRSVTAEGTVIQDACWYLDIPYFEGKEQYWKKKQHVLFGNYSAKFHLYSEDAATEYLSGTFDQERLQFYRSIYYREVKDEALRKTVGEAVSVSAYFSRILDLLAARDVAGERSSDRDTGLNVLRFSTASLEYKRLRQRVRTRIGQVRYGWRS